MNRFRQKNYTKSPDQTERPAPLRDFKHDAQQEENTGRKRRLKLAMYWLLPVCVIALVGIGVVSYPVYEFLSRGATAEDRTAEVDRSTDSGPIEASELLVAHLEAIGGRANLQRIRSVRQKGRISFNSGENDFQIFLLQPDKGMMVVNRGATGRVKLVLNGEFAWEVVEKQDGTRVVTPLTGKGKELLKWSLRVHNSFRAMALAEQSGGLSAREIEYQGKPCYEISQTKPDGTVFLAVLEKETLYLLKTQQMIGLENEMDEFVVIYDDHRMVAGVVEPFATKVYRNGELNNEVKIRSIQRNTGVMSVLFEVPDALHQ